MRNLLLEIGTEEIPAGYLLPAARALAEGVSEALAQQRLEAGKTRTFVTPRRITLLVADVPERQESFSRSVQGPAKKIAFDDEGRPTRAAVGFARGQGVDVGDLDVRDTGKGEYVFAEKRIEGRATADVLAELLPGIVGKLPFPKSMHWDDPKFTFARPIHNVLALLGSQTLCFEVNGIAAGNTTLGHPFLAPEPIEIAEADAGRYAAALREARVIVDHEERRECIRKEIETLLSAHGSQLEEFELLDEVTNLVEFPTALEGNFPERYLSLPEDVVTASMMEHQRYFPVRDARGKLVNRFITVSNRPAEHNGSIREGNERVLNARLSDAEFFWQEDRRHALADYHERLSEVTFQEKLGSYADRVERLRGLVAFIAGELDLDGGVKLKVDRAAFLCKADLVTQMVGEFPGLQGIVGREYARADGEDDEVAVAIAEHYQPRSAKDEPPVTLTGRILALADKFDALVGCFAAGLAPTGSQDPYALRRQIQGIVRIVLSGELTLSLRQVIEKARSLLPEGLGRNDLAAEVLDFIQDRLYYTFLDAGFPHDIIRAVLKPGFDDLLDFSRRLDSLNDLAGTHDWHKLVTAVERTHNITRDFEPSGEVDQSLLSEGPEKGLFALYRQTKDRILDLIDRHAYPEVCSLYEETFAVPLHVFFEKVFVNVEDEALRANRLTLLKHINRLFADRVADLSQIHIEER